MAGSGITIKKIARLLDMSPTTVSRVLNGHARQYRISEKTEKLVREVAKEHHFEPNLLARNLRMQKTNTIGLVIPDISNPFFANLSRIIEIELRKKGKLILLCDTRDDSDLEYESLSLLLAHKVDGLLVAPVGLESAHFNRFTRVPVILIDRYFQKLPLPFVATDNYQGAYDATIHLIDKNHQKIACIRGMANNIANVERVRGFKQALIDRMVSQEGTQILGNYSGIENGYESTKALINNNHRPTAIFTLSNQIAIGTLLALQESDTRIPDDISIISFDEHPYFTLTTPPLTAVKQSIEDIGKKAVDLLMDLMDGKDVCSNTVKAELVERSSVKDLN